MKPARPATRNLRQNWKIVSLFPSFTPAPVRGLGRLVILALKFAGHMTISPKPVQATSFHCGSRLSTSQHQNEQPITKISSIPSHTSEVAPRTHTQDVLVRKEVPSASRYVNWSSDARMMGRLLTENSTAKPMAPFFVAGTYERHRRIFEDGNGEEQRIGV